MHNSYTSGGQLGQESTRVSLNVYSVYDQCTHMEVTQSHKCCLKLLLDGRTRTPRSGNKSMDTASDGNELCFVDRHVLFTDVSAILF